ncbi:tetratricopeptide repeat protein [Patescibacteria group bacterium]
MDQNSASKAIQAALNGDWQKAVTLNLSIIKLSPKDVEACLRLGKAYEELGKINKAKKYYNKVIKLDRFNPIAKRGLNRLKQTGKINKSNHKLSRNFDFDLFLEEPGKTKTVSLVRLCAQSLLNKLNSAQELEIKITKRCISLRDEQNHYLGRLPDDISQRLIMLIARGNKYLAVVKEVDDKKLLIFIKEVERSNKNSGIPSFLAPGEQYHTFLPKKMIMED